MKGFTEFMNEGVHARSTDILHDLMLALKSTSLNTRMTEWRTNEVPHGTLEVRDLGRWENPPRHEMPDDDDGEDYDWQILTNDSASKISEIVKKIEQKYSCQIRWGCNEKNWIDFSLPN